MFFSSDKICFISRLRFGKGNTVLFPRIEASDHPCKVSCKISHRSHAFFIERNFSGHSTVNIVPIGRARNGHLRDAEVFVQTVEGRGRSRSSGNRDRRGGLEFERSAAAVKRLFGNSRKIAQTQQIGKRAAEDFL